jgi:hypothetical protein
MQSGGGADEEFEQQLRRSLYRFDCPEAHALGEYALDLVDASERTRIAAHIVECDECQAELATLRDYLAAPAPVSQPVLDRVRRIVASLFVPAPGLAYGGVRGASDANSRIYEAGNVTISIAPGQSPGSLIGLVVAEDSLEGREVRLLPRQGTPTHTTVDELGNFAVEDLAPGMYALEIELADGILVIEELRVG